jgi:hypothetical protein
MYGRSFVHSVAPRINSAERAWMFGSSSANPSRLAYTASASPTSNAVVTPASSPIASGAGIWCRSRL